MDTIKQSSIYHRTRYDISAVQTTTLEQQIWQKKKKKEGQEIDFHCPPRNVDVPCIVESSSEIINLTKRHYVEYNAK